MIRTELLTTSHGAVRAVNEVSIDIGTGLTAIIGPNGAGKSTLLSTIGRLISADRGVVTVDGMDVFSTRSNRLARTLAVLRQDNHLAIRLSVDDLVNFGRFPHGGSGRTPEDRVHVDRAISLLGLDGVRTRFLDELSGGQRQRAFVAMALAQDTEYLLLDEPLNNLDPRHSISLMKLLQRLGAERAMTIVVVMHDINVAAQFANHVVAMREGAVIQHGPVAEVISEANLTALYDTPVRVANVAGRRVVLWD